MGVSHVRFSAELEAGKQKLFISNQYWIVNQVQKLLKDAIEILKHYTSGASCISTQQHWAKVMETHLAPHFSTIVDISGWARSQVDIWT
jgi:hypothetical protein